MFGDGVKRSFGIQRIHELVLGAVHSWSGKALDFAFARGEAPLATLLHTRCDKHWAENQAVFNLLNSQNRSVWRHWSRGKNIVSWENVLVVAHGLEWKDAASKDLTLWKR